MVMISHIHVIELCKRQYDHDNFMSVPLYHGYDFRHDFKHDQDT